MSSNRVEVIVDSIRMHASSSQYVVFLKEREGERYLPIWIGLAEANSIALKIGGFTSPRPITHDLMVNTLRDLEVDLADVTVTALNGDTFYAQLRLTGLGREWEIDSRPSDAIALAVRTNCPIFVLREVMDTAAVVPEREEEGGEEGGAENDPLAIFRDMVNNLNLPDLPDEPSPGKGPPS